MTDWKQYHLQQNMTMHRDGWVGVWDALVSAVTRRPQHTITQPVTISFWAKHNAEVNFSGVQLEIDGNSNGCN